jgi:DNA mismatch repair protein MutL
MAKVKALKEDVYKKIAAGEVVERPLSVVKELVENSIDAGADTIKIEILEGGKQLIQVSDNGTGFDEDDIEPAFKNYSTSKLSELSDFDNLNTLGFRGEALPSILEVSKIEIKTSNNNEGFGTYCFFEDGKIQKREGIAFNKGTTIAVKDLFYNYPVRKKFLKAERTELNQIITFLENVSLVFYRISFELVHNHRMLFTYKSTDQLKERVYQVFGKEFLDNLQEIAHQEGDYKLHGFISRVNTGVSVKKYQYYYVNQRPVREKTLYAALNNTFKSYVEKTKYPVGILSLEIPAFEVDVNIHPMKLEIKFENSHLIYQFIKRAIEGSFIVINEPEYSEKEVYNKDLPVTVQYPQENSPMKERGLEAVTLFPGNLFIEEDFIIIGQYMNSFIVAEKEKELLIIDQHNAQERVNFDRLKREFKENRVTSISPLFPVIIELTPSDASKLDSRKKEILEKTGFQIEPLSGYSFDIKAFPQILGEKSIKDAFLEILHLEEEREDFEHKVLAKIACKSAIKVNHKLYPDQMKTIVKNLFLSDNPYLCPHKRPILINFSLEQIEKLLKRK